MTKEAAAKQVEVTFEEGVSAVITGASKVEVNGSKVSTSEDFDTIVLNGLKVEHADGRFVFTVSPNDAAPQPAQGAENFVHGQKGAYNGEWIVPPFAAPAPGQMMPDGTIYLGKYTPKDRDGNSLSQKFNVFAAPEDLHSPMNYVDTVKYVATLKGWHGYAGANYANEAELVDAVKKGTYNGEWIVPPRELVDGKNSVGVITQADNILAHMNKGVFKGTFNMARNVRPDCSDWYMSSAGDNNGLRISGIRLSTGSNYTFDKSDSLLSCRPVRLVPCK